MTKTILGVRSVPLAQETSDAWREHGVVFRRRKRLHVWDTRFHEPHIKMVLNLGNLDMRFKNIPVPLFNAPDTIRAVSAPSALRKTMPELVPESTIYGPHWHKRNGFRGVGKQYHEGMLNACAIWGGDAQKHVEGPEYRVLSVGEHVVQAFRKMPIKEFKFDFKWVGVEGVSQNGIIPLVKEAVGQVPNGVFSVFGWDIIVGPDGPVIIECNTSPGVNEYTAGRIVDMMKRIVE